MISKEYFSEYLVGAKDHGYNEFSFLKLVLDNEAEGNAFGLGTATELRRRLKTLKSKPVHGLFLTNKGSRFFCTGGNLNEQLKVSRAQSLKTQKSIREVLGEVSSLPIPTVVAVQGDAFGGGAELLASFDYVLCTPKVQIGIWQRRLGVTFGWGGGQKLLQRLGEKKLRQSFVQGKVWNAFESERLGLVDEVVLPSLIEARAWSWLAQAAGLPAEALEKFRKWTPENEIKTFESLWFKKDHQQALKSFKPSR